MVRSSILSVIPSVNNNATYDSNVQLENFWKKRTAGELREFPAHEAGRHFETSIRSKSIWIAILYEIIRIQQWNLLFKSAVRAEELYLRRTDRVAGRPRRTCRIAGRSRKGSLTGLNGPMEGKRIPSGESRRPPGPPAASPQSPVHPDGAILRIRAP